MRIGCQTCGKVLTDEERRWYGSTCNQCEGEWLERIEAWRRGGPDVELDAIYDGPHQSRN